MDVTLRCPDDADALTKLIRQTTNAKQRDRLRAVQLFIVTRAQHTHGRHRQHKPKQCNAIVTHRQR